MPKSSTTLKAGDNLPPRGRSNKTKILEALKAESFEGLADDSTKDQAEVAWFRHIVKRARNPDDKDSGMLLKWLGDKGWSSVKPMTEIVQFDFPENASEADKANAILLAVTKGLISVDHGQGLSKILDTVKDAEMLTTIKERLEILEKALNERDSE